MYILYYKSDRGIMALVVKKRHGNQVQILAEADCITH